ncbi:MAG: ornithine cyclodeaminase [Pseudomonadota bacterium]
MKMIDIETLLHIIEHIGLNTFYQMLIETLEEDFGNWNQFSKSPRHAIHTNQGVIELMPCANNQFYSFKYVNGHPSNTLQNKLCVVAIGMLSDAKNGYPLLISEMTLLTALRTAATAALAAKYLARKESKHLAIIGTGAQAEFQVLAMLSLYPLTEVSFYDIDAKAMDKFANNLEAYDFKLNASSSIKSCVQAADIIISATAAKKQASLFSYTKVKPGTHIHAMGGDCPGKTEFDANMLKNSKVVVEYLAQSKHEGEIQQVDESIVHAELWEIIQAKKSARENNQEITFFDSVGFALEDFSVLRLVYHLSLQLEMAKEVDLIPQLKNAKDLFSLLKVK